MATPVPSPVLDRVFGALAHPARRQILIILHARGGEMSAGEIADRFKHSWPTTTRHLGVLEKARVLTVGKRGRQRFYTLQTRPLAQTGAWLCNWAATPAESPEGEWTGERYGRLRNAVPPERGEAADD